VRGRPAKAWFRVYTEILDPSDKIRNLSHSDRGIWILLLAICRKNAGKIPNLKAVAAYFQTTPAKAQTILDHFTELRILDVESGVYTPHNWKERQFESDIRSRNEANSGHEIQTNSGHGSTVYPLVSPLRQRESRAEQIQKTTEEGGRDPDSSLGTGEPPTPTAASNGATPSDLKKRILALAENAPNQQSFKGGVDLAIQTVLSSADPSRAIETMEHNIPGWWQAMRDGRAGVRSKCLRWLIQDGDWLREAPALVTAQPQRRETAMDRLRKRTEDGK